MAFLLCLSPNPAKPPQNSSPSSKSKGFPRFEITSFCDSSRRNFALKTATVSIFSLSLSFNLPFGNSLASAEEVASKKSILSGIANTKSWFQFLGDGFAIRVPPQFEDIMEPEDYSAGLSLYGDKAKPKTYAARFASPDGSEVVSVLIRPSNQLKITFLEAKDVSDLGSLKDSAKLFVPGRATLYSARTIKIREDEGYRTYYFYEYGVDQEHIAVVAAVNSGKVFVAGAAAPNSKWEDDGVKLRSAAMSLSIL